MANETWFEIDNISNRYSTIETVRPMAVARARETDDQVEIYQVTRTLVRTVQRNVSVAETPVP